MLTATTTLSETGGADRIRERRLAVGLTRLDLARLADCSMTMLQNIEGGAVPRRSEVVPRILAVLEAHDPATTKTRATTPGPSTSSAVQRPTHGP